MIVRVVILLQAFLAFETLTGVAGANHRCFVCIPNSGSSISDVVQLYPKGTTIPLCNEFDAKDSKYIKECPSESYQGCLTQTNGTHVTKTCTEVGIEDCKTANKITYCYCKGDLCNGEAVPVEAPVPQETEEEEDDEDSPSEGSGYFEESDSGQMETSSETDVGLEVVRKHFPTTTESVILTTNRPRSTGPVKASAGRFVPAVSFVFVPFLLVLKL